MTIHKLRKRRRPRAHSVALGLVVVFVCVLFCSGCSTDAEDREFFNAGWVHPEKGAEARIGDTARMTRIRSGGALTPNAPPERREPAF
jgi:hypothetical protein